MKKYYSSLFFWKKRNSSEMVHLLRQSTNRLISLSSKQKEAANVLTIIHQDVQRIIARENSTEKEVVYNSLLLNNDT